MATPLLLRNPRPVKWETEKTAEVTSPVIIWASAAALNELLGKWVLNRQLIPRN
jgi:hypothetical protein